MFSLGLTADAAAAHRHEFSRPVAGVGPGNFMGRNGLRAPVLSLPPLRAPSIIPLDPEKRKTLPAMLREQSTYGSSDEDFSRSNSLNSLANSQGGSTRRKRRERPKTSFRIAHPPPVIKPKQKLRIRPRILLQLQQLSESTHHTPALDVLPSTIFAPRLASRFPRAFRGKDRLGTNDLIIVGSESYEHRSVTEDDKSDSSQEETWEQREVVATICQLPTSEGRSKGKVEISFNQGATWEGTPLANGSYEFVTLDRNGSKSIARWVPRSKGRRRTSTLVPSLNGSILDDDKKFTFSLVNPNTRRHPVIASMTRTSVDVADQYPPTATSPNTPSSVALSPSVESTNDASFFEGLDVPEQSLVQTDDYLRVLIIVTGVWVAFREGWSKNFLYNDAMAVPLSPLSTTQPRHRRHTSESQRTIKPDQAPDYFDPNPRNGLHRISDNSRRSSSHLLRRSSPASSPSPLPGSDGLAPPRRSFSTGAAFIEKANRGSVSLAKKSRQPYPGLSSGESEEEHIRFPSGVGTPTKPALRPRPVSDSHVISVAASLAEKKHVHIQEPRFGDASDETTLADTNITLAVPPAERKVAAVLQKKKNTNPKRRWRRVLRILGLSRRKGEVDY